MFLCQTANQSLKTRYIVQRFEHLGCLDSTFAPWSRLFCAEDEVRRTTPLNNRQQADKFTLMYARLKLDNGWA